MREILFKGKRIANGEWVYGYVDVSSINGDVSIKSPQDECWYRVDPATVGQFTGIELYNDPLGLNDDYSKVNLFEGDTVEFSEFDYNGADKTRTGVVYWCGTAFWIDCTEKHGTEAIYSLQWAFDQDECMRVIGTIHDKEAHDGR